MNAKQQGFFALENSQGRVVRSFNWESNKITVIFRHDQRRIETVSSLKELEELEIPFSILAESTPADIRKGPLKVAGGGTLRWVSSESEFSPSYELSREDKDDVKRIVGISAGVQAALVGLLVLGGAFVGTSQKAPEATVTLIPQEQVQEMLKEAEQKPKQPEQKQSQAAVREQQQIAKSRKIVVAPSETKITKNTPVPTRSSSFKKTAHVATAHTKPHQVHGGGYKGEGKRGYGTNEEHMNSIGALGALNNNEKRVHGGNGGHGGVNLQAVGNEAGSGAGGHGFGGFGHNGGGGHGLGGLGHGKGMGLSNSMYGKGLIAAPFGDGSPAPGAGGYGTRGKAGGGAQGAGYGDMTMVGSWKGTGPKGDGPAGSGAGNGDPNGSPWGAADASTDDNDVLVTGGLDRDQIAEVIARHMGEITYCYEQGLQRKPTLSGRVADHFQIGPRGRVDFSRVAHSSVHSAQVENCIAGRVKSWVFPKPVGGVSVAVTYPFVLRRMSDR